MKDNPALLFEAKKSLIHSRLRDAEQLAAQERETDRAVFFGPDGGERVKELRFNTALWTREPGRDDVLNQPRRLSELVRLEAPEKRVYFVNNSSLT